MLERLSEKVVLGLLEATSFSFKPSQRKAIVERDKEFGIKKNKGGCQAPENHPCHGDKKIHVHHVRPQRYCVTLGVDPDFPENAISLCDEAHVGGKGKHPDTAKAKENYAKGDKKAFEKMGEERQEKLDERTIYWDDKTDRQLDMLALRATQKKDKKEGGRFKWWPWSK